MDPVRYKDFTTSRGTVYHYYYSAALGSQPTLLLNHGFPSTSQDWRKQVSFFEPLGYGLVVPDQLGYGGTSKPSDVDAYKRSLVTKDLMEILDAESVLAVIAIGHDWGSMVTSRLANYYPDRFKGFGFIAVPYQSPNPGFNLEKALKKSREMFGYETIGYWKFFSEDGASELITNKFDSFMNIVFPNPPELWKNHLASLGGLKEWLSSDKRSPLPSYLNEAEVTAMGDALLQGGIAAPLNWYKIMTSGINAADEHGIPRERYIIEKPVFFAACAFDYIGVAAASKLATAAYCQRATIRDYDADHWVILSHADELNQDLLAWIQAVDIVAKL